MALSLLIANDATAFDSSGAELGTVTHNVPIPSPAYPFYGNYFSGPGALPYSYDRFYTPSGVTPGPGIHYLAAFSHGSVGGLTGDANDDRSVGGLYTCARGAIDSGNARDLQECELLVSTVEKEVTNVGWVRAHRAWNVNATGEVLEDGHSPEHLLIVRAAATLAGFDAVPLLKQRFWVRYPGRNRYVASPVSPDPRPEEGSTDPPKKTEIVVMGQSWQPVPFSELETHVVRGVSLPELAQMPDVSSSIDDWAFANETCPVKGIQHEETGASIFGGASHKYDINACHEYARVLGPLNASHFLPAAESYYRYYHRLAKERIVKCKDLVVYNTSHYDNQEALYASPFGFRYERASLSSDTEGHECEREAFVYEMFAQHYLQDAWATGHMWARWGHPELTSFPAGLDTATFTLGGPLGFTTSFDNPLPPPENLPGRRLVIADVVAAYAGMIHGAKAVTSEMMRGSFSWLDAVNTTYGRKALDFVAGDSLDDPLSAPKYYDLLSSTSKTIDVTWRDAGSTPLYPGAGDLWLQKLSLADGTTTETVYAEQRNRLLGCAAASLREVYALGPKMNGELAPADPRVGGIDPAGDSCWKHWATNSSMLGATSPFLLQRKWGGTPPEPETFKSKLIEKGIAYANHLVVDEVEGGVLLPGELDAVLFHAALVSRMNEDHMTVMKTFVMNARHDPKGTESAQLIDMSDPATPKPMPKFFNVAANQSYGDGSTAPSIAHIDHADDLGMRHVFWRSHIKETCAEGLATQPSGKPLIAELRDRCIASAANHGNPEVCTACVELAEMHVPRSSGLAAPTELRSKCAILGVGDASSLPPEFFSVAGTDHAALGTKLEENNYLYDRPAYWGAFSYCTGTKKPSVGLVHGLADQLVTQFPSTPSACGSHDVPGTAIYRVGVVHSEYPMAAPTPWTPPVPGLIVNANNVQFSYAEHIVDSECSTEERTDLSSVVPAKFLHLNDLDGQLLPTSAYPTNFRRRLSSDVDALGTTFCGQVQRLTWWDKSCAAAADAQEVADDGFPQLFSASWTDGEYDPLTGFQAREYVLPAGGVDNGTRCEIREARHIINSNYCRLGTCGAGGICLGGAASPALLYLDSSPSGSGDTCYYGIQGGPYRRLCVDTGVEERHHMPSAESIVAIKLSYVSAPAVKLSVADHELTSSYGSRASAQLWRRKQAELIAHSKFKEAQQMDIDDLRRLFGSKYNVGIAQMEAYTSTINDRDLLTK